MIATPLGKAVLLGGAAALDVDAATLIAAMTTPPDAARQSLINTTIRALKTAGIWAKLDELWFLAAHNSQAGLLGWKRNKDLTEISSPTFTADKGYAGNGTSSYLNTGYVPSTQGVNYQLDNASLAVWSWLEASNTTSVDIGARNSSSANFGYIQLRSTDTARPRINQSTAPAGAANTSETGLFVAQRQNSTQAQIWRNGVNLQTVTATRTGIPAYAVYIGALNEADTPLLFSPRQYGYAHVGAGLSQSEQEALYSIVAGYMDGLNSAGQLIASTTTLRAVSSPQNAGVFFDGTYYWLFYIDGTTLKCKYGTSLLHLTSTGGNLVTSVDNAGAAWSCVFGQLTSGGIWYVWVLVSRNSGASGQRSNVYRWQLSSGGLADAQSHIAALSTASMGLAQLTGDYGDSVINALYRATEDLGESASDNIYARSIAPDLTGDTDMVAYNPTGFGFCELGTVYKLSDGYIVFALDDGDSGGTVTPGARECTKTLVGDAWGTESAELGFSNLAHAVNTSHVGQKTIIQLDSGDIYVAYVDDTGAADDYGRIRLRKRGSAQASTWSTLSTDVVGEDAWHIATTTDGEDIWLFWLPDNGGSRSSTLRYRKYDVSAASWGVVQALAIVRSGKTFERMFTQPRIVAAKCTVAYSEFDGASAYDVMAAELEV